MGRMSVYAGEFPASFPARIIPFARMPLHAFTFRGTDFAGLHAPAGHTNTGFA